MSYNVWWCNIYRVTNPTPQDRGEGTAFDNVLDAVTVINHQRADRKWVRLEMQVTKDGSYPYMPYHVFRPPVGGLKS